MYLVDGNPNGIMTVEIMNWTGVVTVSPKTQLADLASRSEIRRTGIYILVGNNPESPSFQEVVYIGESDCVWDRLTQHIKDPVKEVWWRRTVIITSKDDNLTKAHIRYLESRLISLGIQAQRAKITNGTNPDVPRLPEPDIADMEYFLEQVQMLLPVLGLTFAMPLPTLENEQLPELVGHESPIFYMNYKKAKAFAREVNGEFVILKDSTLCKEETSSLASSYRQLRSQLLADGKLVDSDNADCWRLTQDLPLTSPSAAACVVGGLSLNGRATWQVKDANQSYASWQDSRLEKAQKVVQPELEQFNLL
ncbi:MAG: GIY-YIG nuclease family protein [Leptolyngbyaceae cyanobacterium bins.302]|nr:GIY-YIG nuclease family protein [Leptolyngbyaceae cyanobacterium bins.302]